MDLKTQLAYWAEAHSVSFEDAQCLTNLSDSDVAGSLPLMKLGAVKWEPTKHWPSISITPCVVANGGEATCPWCFPKTPAKKPKATNIAGSPTHKVKAGDVFVVQFNAAGTFDIPEGASVLRF